MDWKLEPVVLPVTGVDRAKSFYADQVVHFSDPDGNAWSVQELPARS